MAFNPTNGLCSLADLKSALRLTDDTDDDRLNLAIDAASRQIENKCGRRFWQDSSVNARTYVPSTPFLCEVDDFFDLSDLIVQTDPYGDGTWQQTWVNPTLAADGSLSGGDFQLEPLNALNEGQPWPYTRIRDVRSLLFPIYGGIAYPVPYTQALIKITTKFGWNYIPSDIHKACVLQAMLLYKSDDTPFGATAFAEIGIVRQKDEIAPTARALISKYRETVARVA